MELTTGKYREGIGKKESFLISSLAREDKNLFTIEDARAIIGDAAKKAVYNLTEVITFIGSDNFDGGRIAGEYIISKLNGKGKVAILEGIPGHETGDARLSGFHQAVDQVPGIEIVASQTANWERDQGFNVFQNILQSHPPVQALFAHWSFVH